MTIEEIEIHNEKIEKEKWDFYVVKFKFKSDIASNVSWATLQFRSNIPIALTADLINNGAIDVWKGHAYMDTLEVIKYRNDYVKPYPYFLDEKERSEYCESRNIQ